jgi:NAD(P)-dependent dehydrogenase (short-subunit alcohol dehydrogenase family)
VLVVGASGLLGNVLCRALESDGFEVTGTSFSRSVPDMVQLDLRDPAAVEAATAHYRLAMTLGEELGMRPLVALCHLGLGRLWRTGRVDAARAELETARALLGGLGMTAAQRQAEADLAALPS